MTIVLTEIKKILGISINENGILKVINLIDMVIDRYTYDLVALEKLKRN